MCPAAYLTIDDSPSTRMDDLVDYLEGKGVPALFFCRGDLLEQNSAAALRAIHKGFVIANHAYSHQRSSHKEFAWIVEDIERCEALIDDLYSVAHVKRTGKYFRFPHLDRGAGGWIVDYDRYDKAIRDSLIDTFVGGLNIPSFDRPPQDSFDKMAMLQRYLTQKGFSNPFRNLTIPWASVPDIADAGDCLYTFSNCDWMLTSRHLGKWPYQTVQDLKHKAKSDPFLMAPEGRSVILAHDQAEIVDITIQLVDDLLQNGLQFLEV